MADELEGFSAPQPEAGGGDAPFVCDVDGCGVECRTWPSLRRHQSMKHGMVGAAAGKLRSPRPSRASSSAAPSLRDQAEAFTMFFYGMGGQMVATVDPTCGQALMACQPEAAKAWAEVARRNKYVRKMITSTGGASCWAGLVMAHLPLLMAVQAHHLAPAMAAGPPAAAQDTFGPTIFDRAGEEAAAHAAGAGVLG